MQPGGKGCAKGWWPAKGGSGAVDLRPRIHAEHVLARCEYMVEWVDEMVTIQWARRCSRGQSQHMHSVGGC